MFTLRLWKIVVALALASILAAGCMTREQFQEGRDKAAQGLETARETLDSVKASQEAALAEAARLEIVRKAAVDAGDLIAAADAASLRDAYTEAADKMTQTIAGASEAIETGERLLDSLDEQLAEWDAGGSGVPVVDEIGSVVLPFVPPPYRAPAVLGFGLIAAGLRAWQSRKALNSLAKSSVKLAEKHPEVASAIAAEKQMLDEKQTPTAKRAIDAAQGKAKALPI